MGFVEIEIESARYQSRDNGKFGAMVEAATDAAAYNAARRGASHARGILGGAWGGGVHIDAEGGGGSWRISAEGQWAEAAEFGIPDHPIDASGYSLYNPGYPFPSYLDKKGKPIPVKHVDHPGTQDYRMIESAGDLIAGEFLGILVSHLP